MRGKNWEYFVIRYLHYTQSSIVFYEGGLRLVFKKSIEISTATTKIFFKRSKIDNKKGETK